MSFNAYQCHHAAANKEMLCLFCLHAIYLVRACAVRTAHVYSIVLFYLMGSKAVQIHMCLCISVDQLVWPKALELNKKNQWNLLRYKYKIYKNQRIHFRINKQSCQHRSNT